MKNNQSAWLIEFKSESEVILYFGGLNCNKLTVPNSAIRFSRREDAQKMLDGMIDAHILHDRNKWQVNEHIWVEGKGE